MAPGAARRVALGVRHAASLGARAVRRAVVARARYDEGCHARVPALGASGPAAPRALYPAGRDSPSENARLQLVPAVTAEGGAHDENRTVDPTHSYGLAHAHPHAVCHVRAP